MRSARAATAFVALLLVLGSGACGDSGSDGDGASSGTGDAVDREPPTSAAATVELLPTTFDPENVSVKVGETVLWTWQGGVQHNVNGGDAFKSKLLTKGRFDHTFTEPGEYPYRCDVHPTTMKGTVTVT